MTQQPFDKIKLPRIRTLCNILSESNIHQLSYIKSKYCENELCFDETLSFLFNLDLVENKSNELIPKRLAKKSHSTSEFQEEFLSILFSANTDISNHLRLFLINFKSEKGEVFYIANTSNRIKFSSVRNLLLELDFIKPYQIDKGYILNPKFRHFYQSLFSKKLAPKAFKKELQKKESLGLNAEKVVIDFELKRLSNISLAANEIVHTALINVAAGYDIVSFEDYLDSDSLKINRYIEVKAVSIQDYKFVWSRNEIEMARLFGDRYFLYLLPVISENLFDPGQMRIINNPIENLFNNPLEWKKVAESFSFARIVSK